MGIEAVFPKPLEATATVNAAQGQDVLGPWLGPPHAGLFAASADDRLAPGLDNA